ncbi:MAG: hypothetical protein JWM11_1222 [Planctomycetaceae bacterium]|nr:hypothetical protein [Planctomycetaceae bacterium]
MFRHPEIRAFSVGFVACLLPVGFAGAQNGNQQAETPRINAVNSAQVQPGRYSGGPDERPWFSHPEIRRELNLKNEEYRDLYQNYNQSWAAYNQGLSNLEKDQLDIDRAQLQQSLYGSFSDSLSQAADNAIQDPSIRKRFDQLHLQYRGYSAFGDPAVQQRLNLTEKQRTQFDTYHREWDQNLITLGKSFSSNRAGTLGRFNRAQQDARERINLTLTPEQRATWIKMIGQQYSFPADAYLPTRMAPG